MDTFASDTKLSSCFFFFFFENSRSATVKEESLESDFSSKERGFGIFKKGQGLSKFNIASLNLENMTFVTLRTFSSTNLFRRRKNIFARFERRMLFFEHTMALSE